MTEPKFLSVKQSERTEREPIVALEVNGDARAYPLRQIWYHHVVNDRIGGERLAVTYCSMANTATVYRLPEESKGLEAAGLLGGVLVLKDIGGSQVWPQIRCGAPVPDNETSATLALGPPPVITTLGAWGKSHPATRVLAPDNRFDLYYTAYDMKPQGYHPGALMSASGASVDARLTGDTDVVGVAVGRVSRAYPISLVREKKRISDTIGGTEVTVLWDEALGAARVESKGEVFWVRAFWYGWAGFYPETEISGEAAK